MMSNPQKTPEKSHQNGPSYFLAEDLESKNTMSSDKFIELILGTPDKITPLSRYRQDRYDDALSRYQGAIAESNHQAPFDDLTKEILLNTHEFCNAKSNRDLVNILVGDEPQDKSFHWPNLAIFVWSKEHGTKTKKPKSFVLVKDHNTTGFVVPFDNGPGGSSQLSKRKREVENSFFEIRSESYVSKRRKKVFWDDDPTVEAAYAIVVDQWVQLIFYDRSILIFSEPFDFIAEPEKFYLVLQQLAKHSDDCYALGYRGRLKSSCELLLLKDENHIFEGQEFKLTNGLVLLLGRTLFRQHVIIGRGTTTVIAKVKNSTHLGNVRDIVVDDHAIWKGEIVVKFSWPAKSRIPEADFVNEARSKAELEGEQRILNHLPKTLYTEDCDSPEVSTRLAIHFGEDVYEQRLARATVSERLYPITDITDPEALRKAMSEIIDCHRWLHDKADTILHRDISVSNLMLRKRDGETYGVLNDFGLSTRVIRDEAGKVLRRDDSPSYTTRTGTWPFMAVDLLISPPPEHIYRHDLESFFYVMLWITTRDSEGETPLHTWNTFDKQRLAENKLFFFARFPENLMPKDAYLPLKVAILKIRNSFVRGSCAHNNQSFMREMGIDNGLEFNDVTMDGHVTTAMLLEALKD